MKRGSCYWDYSTYSDILNIHKKDKSTKGSAELGDFSIDFDDKGNIVGVEIMHASEFLKNFNIAKKQLENIKAAKILINKRNPQVTLVWLGLTLAGNIERQIPVMAPVIAR